jgi:hypothetical protein
MSLSCSSCKEEKDESLFPLATGKTRGYAWVCKACKKSKHQAKKASMSSEDWFLIQRRYWLKTEYGLSLEDYNSKVKEQDHKCAICKCDETEAFKGLLFVDHCHTTGKVRGLLCHHCNTALGKFKDSKEILSSALDYVEKYNGTAN